MPAPTLEQISVALFAKAQAIPGLVEVSRELRPWDDVPSVQQPALFHVEEEADAPPPETVAGGRSVAVPTQWSIAFTWYLYVHRSTCGAPLLSTARNGLIEAIRDALRPGAGSMAQTLGGLVADCRIAGPVNFDGGTLGDQAVAIVPIAVLCLR